jgi:hypothetical protein
MKKLFLSLVILFGIYNTSSALCYISCTASGQCYNVDTHNSPDRSTWTWTPCGYCPPNEPWVVQVNCSNIVQPGGGNGNTTDGHGNTIDEGETAHIATYFSISAVGTYTPTSDDINNIQYAIQNNLAVSVYIDGTQLTPAVETYFINGNPANYPPTN